MTALAVIAALWLVATAVAVAVCIAAGHADDALYGSDW